MMDGGWLTMVDAGWGRRIPNLSPPTHMISAVWALPHIAHKPYMYVDSLAIGIWPPMDINLWTTPWYDAALVSKLVPFTYPFHWRFRNVESTTVIMISMLYCSVVKFYFAEDESDNEC